MKKVGSKRRRLATTLSKVGSKRRRLATTLSTDVALEILSWLPAKSVVRFRCACKLWHSATQEPDFIDTHLERAQMRPPSILLSPITPTPEKELISILDTNTWTIKQRFKAASWPPPPPDEEEDDVRQLVRLQNTVNGLLCTSGAEHGDSIQLLNPTTGESLSIPNPISADDDDVIFTVILGFHPETKEYKIIYIYRNMYESVLRCKVHTVGGDTSLWRQTNPPPDFRPKSWQMPLVKGKVYFISSGFTVFSFDLKLESFASIPHPNFEGNNQEATTIIELQGNVCLLVQSKDVIENTDIWMLNTVDNNKQKWTFKYSITSQIKGIVAPLFVFGNKMLVKILVDEDVIGQNKTKGHDTLSYHDLDGANQDIDVYEYDYSYDPFVHVESLVQLRNHP